MIGTVGVRVTAGHPNMPLSPVTVFVGSAAAISPSVETICNTAMNPQ